jgi:hypothetical protein
MSRRARIWLQAREAKRLPHDLSDVPDDDDEVVFTGVWSCPGCSKARSEPFHCTPCNADAEGPGYDD